MLVIGDTGFFQNELSWDGIIGLAIFVVAGVVGLSIWAYRSWWRSKHLIRADFSRDPYSFKVDDSERNVSSRWESPVGGPFSALIRITPHVGAAIRSLELRFVGRRIPLPMMWRRVAPEVIRANEIVDMRYAVSSAPLYYFESDEEHDGSCRGWYFDDHDKAKGRDISADEPWWIALKFTTNEAWTGRLEIDLVINGQRIRERKPFRSREDCDPEKYPLFVDDLYT